MNEKVGVVYQQLLKTANRKQQNTDNVLLLVENCDIKAEILNKLAHLNQLETKVTVMSELFFSQGFSLGHMIITTIIKLGDASSEKKGPIKRSQNQIEEANQPVWSQSSVCIVCGSLSIVSMQPGDQLKFSIRLSCPSKIGCVETHLVHCFHNARVWLL